MPDLTYDLESKYDNNFDNLLKPNSEDDDLEFISIENLRNTPDSNQCNKTNLLENINTLPVHMRCAAHTFNLVARKDADAALKITIFKTPYNSAIAKARALWNQQIAFTLN